MTSYEQIASTGTLIGALLILLIGVALIIGAVYLLVKCYRKLSTLEELVRKNNRDNE